MPTSRPARSRCCSTATAPSSSTCRTTATRDLVAPDARRGRGGRRACARPGCRSASSRTSPGIARGIVTREQVDAVNARVDELFGGVRRLAGLPARPRGRLRLPQARARHGAARPRRRSASTRRARVVIGDIGADVGAAHAAGAHGGARAHPGHAPGGGRGPPAPSRPTSAPPVRLALAGRRRMKRVLVARLDSMGDVLVSGPAVRAVAAAGRGRAARRPAGRRRRRACCPASPRCGCSPRPGSPPTDRPVDADLVAEVAAARRGDRRRRRPCSSPPSTSRRCRSRCCCASPGVTRITGASVDAAGGLLDVRLIPGEDLPEDLPEPLRALRIAAAAGLPAARRRRRRARRRAARRAARGGRGRRPVRRRAPGRRRARARLPGRALRARVVALLADARPPRARHRRPGRARAHRARSPAAPASTSAARSTSPRSAPCCATPTRSSVGNTGPAHLAAAAGHRRSSACSRPSCPPSGGRRGACPSSCSATRTPPAAAPGPASARSPGTRASPPSTPESVVDGRRAPDRSGRMKVLLWHVHGGWTDAFVARRPRRTCSPRRPRATAGASAAAAATGRRARGRAGGDPRRGRRRRRAAAPGGARGGRAPAPAAGSAATCPRVYLEHNTPEGRRADRRCTRWPTATTSSSCTSPTRTRCSGTPAAPAPRVIEHGVRDPGRALHRRARAVRAPSSTSRCAAGGSPAPTCCPGSPTVAPVDVFGMGTDLLAGAFDGAPGDRRRSATCRRPRMHAALAERRAYLHPHRWTSLGLSLIEAMHLGMPVVALAATEAPRAVPPEAGAISADVDELVAAARAAARGPGRGAPPRARSRARSRSSATASAGSSRTGTRVLDDAVARRPRSCKRGSRGDCARRHAICEKVAR